MNMSDVSKALTGLFVSVPWPSRYFWSIGSHKMLAMGDYVLCVLIAAVASVRSRYWILFFPQPKNINNQKNREKNREYKHFNSYYLTPMIIIASPKWLTGGNG